MTEEDRTPQLNREDIVLTFRASELREMLVEKGQQQAVLQNEGVYDIQQAEQAATLLFIERLCFYVGVAALNEGKSIREEWEHSLELDSFTTYLNVDLTRGSLEQVLAAWLTPADSNWRWRHQLKRPQNQSIRGYGMINRFYTPCIRMAAFACGYTVEAEKASLDKAYIQKAREFADKQASKVNWLKRQQPGSQS